MAVAWVILFLLSALFPWLVFHQTSRRKATAVAFAYFTVASSPMIPVCQSYWPGQPIIWIVPWLAASSTLALPWLLLWHANANQRIWRIPASLLLSAVPPIGIIGWASPLTAAGLLFPGMGLAGLAATALAEATWTTRPKIVAAGILAANLLYIPPTQTINIRAINTTDFPDPFQKEETARRSLQNSTAAFTILPEGAVRRWTEATEVFWVKTINHLKANNRTALIGAGIPIPGSNEFHNSVITVGASPTLRFNQRIPIPFGMWKPFGPDDGVPLNLTGPGVLMLGEHRIAILICYEQLLVWPIVHSALHKPTLIAGLANTSWTQRTIIPSAQEACLQAWSRLLGIPKFSAVSS